MLMLSLVILPATALTFVKDNLYYRTLSATTVEVTNYESTDKDGSDVFIPLESAPMRAMKASSVGYEVVIPVSVTNEGKTYQVIAVGDNAFLNMSRMASVSLPNSIESIGKSAFAGCSSLTSISCFTSAPPVAYANSFASVDKQQCVLYISPGTRDLYAAATGWSEFQNIVEPGYQLVYKVDGDVYATYNYVVGASITPIAAPAKEGHTFSGWSNVPSTMPAQDIVVTGTFAVNSYMLTYVVDGQNYKTQSVQYGATITPETAPTKEGYTFSRWEGLTATMPAADLTVTASYSVNSYTLTYKVNGSIYKSYSVQYGTSIVPEPEPTGDSGLEFSGWSTIPSTMPAQDITISGSFVRSAYPIVDKEVYDKSEDEMWGPVRYTRTFSNTHWQAMYIPFSIPVSTLEENGLEVAELNDTHMYDRDEDGKFEDITLEFLLLKSGSTEPNYPYIIRANEVGLKTLALTDVDLEKSEALSYECSTLKQTFTITGTYTGVDGQTMFDNNYYAMGGGVLGRVSSAGVALSPQRWYVSVANKNGSPVDYYAPSMRISVDGIMEEETGIDAISANPEQNGTMSDLLGRRVKDVHAPGLYIRNGVKVMLK